MGVVYTLNVLLGANRQGTLPIVEPIGVVSPPTTKMPDNASRIRDDLYARGHASGLKDGELEPIWRSVNRQLGGHHAQM